MKMPTGVVPTTNISYYTHTLCQHVHSKHEWRAVWSVYEGKR